MQPDRAILPLAFALIVLAAGPASADDGKICIGELQGDGVAACTRLIQAAQNVDQRSLFLAHRGVALLNAKQYPRALADFNEGIKINFKCSRCYAGRAAYYMTVSRQLDLARRDVNRALELQPDLEFAQLLLKILNKTL